MNTEKLDNIQEAVLNRRLRWLEAWLALRQGDIGHLRTTFLQICYFTARARMDARCAFHMLCRLNNHFKEPLKRSYILNSVVGKAEKRSTIIKYKNKIIISMLGITPEEEDVLDIWFYDKRNERLAQQQKQRSELEEKIINMYKQTHLPATVIQKSFPDINVRKIQRIIKAAVEDQKKTQTLQILKMAADGASVQDIQAKTKLSRSSIYDILSVQKTTDFLRSEALMRSSESFTFSLDGKLEFFSLDTTEKIISEIDEQAIALRKLQSSKGNVAVLGRAGTGKTTLLKRYLDSLSPEERTATLLASPTGIAAAAINGRTIHSIFGFDNGIQPNKRVTAIPKNLSTIKRLIIDEIGAVRVDIFNRIAQILRYAKRKNHFIQLIVMGDFAQIAPIVTNEQDLKDYPNGHFAFHSELWNKMHFKKIVLNQVHRQSDKDFIMQLQNLRLGMSSAVKWFNLHASKVEDPNAPYICPTKERVQHYNNLALKKFAPEELISFKAMIKGIIPQDSYPCPELLQLAVGMRVRTVTNAKLYKNGSLGTITAIYGNSIAVKLDSGNTVTVKKQVFKLWEDGTTFTQFPLEMAYAFTVNKAQGLTFDSVNIVRSSRFFAPGMLYVALSRVKNLDGLHIIGKLRQNDLIIDQEALRMMQP